MRKLMNIRKKSIVDSIIEQILQGIINDTFKPGEKIPSEQEIANQMGVSRNSVREAVKTLISYGILEIKRPEGTYVCKGFVSPMINPSIYGLIIGSNSSKDIIMLRKMFDIGLMHCAIDVVDNKSLLKIENKLEKLKKALKGEKIDLDKVVQCDVDFHMSIEAGVNNPLTHIVSDMITRITLFSRKNTIKNHINSGNIDKMIEIHEDLYLAIKNRDRENVAQVVERSYELWKTII